MKIGSLSSKTGLSVDTIRYYERIGLLPRADRDGSGQRDYDDTILEWVAFLKRLKETGMPIAQMLEYASLRDQGKTTISMRQHILEEHRIKVKQDISSLQTALSALDAKIHTYQKMANSDDHESEVNKRNPPRTR